MNRTIVSPGFIFSCLNKKIIKNQSFNCFVRYSSLPLLSKKRRAEGNTTNYFVDWTRTKVKGGNGGDGCISFLRLFCNPWAGPDGGDGGNGGHIIFQADHNTNSLGNLNSEYHGMNGENGSSKDCNGKSSEHTIIKVPIGTLFKNQENILVCDLDQDEAIFIAARGGAGGRGNHYFLSNENRAPLVAEIGAIGEEKKYFVELRIMAHAGLIGFPNAGKSSLLRAISRAKPKIAAYPFTTLNPHVGIIHYDDYEQLSIADLPGLVNGAHKNEGLGIEFLRHVERCACLMYVIDLSEMEPWNQYRDLQYELSQYNANLIHRPRAIIGNKIDLPESQKNLATFQELVNLPVIPVSAKYRIGILKMLTYVREITDAQIKKDLANAS